MNKSLTSNFPQTKEDAIQDLVVHFLESGKQIPVKELNKELLYINQLLRQYSFKLLDDDLMNLIFQLDDSITKFIDKSELDKGQKLDIKSFTSELKVIIGEIALFAEDIEIKLLCENLLDEDNEEVLGYIRSLTGFHSFCLERFPQIIYKF